MIVKGKSRAQAAQAGKYLLEKGKNDRTELIEIKGTLSQNVKDAMREMEAVAAGSQCEKFLYHASINLKEGEQLTPEQWQYSVDLLAKNLGLEGHQRIVAEHFKDNRTHRHIIFNRVNPETLKAVHMSNSYHAHELTARQLEKEFGLDRVKGAHILEGNEPPAERGPTHNETKQAEKTGVNIRKWRNEIRRIAAWAADHSGAEIIAALEKKGHMVARGDNVDFIILDPSGTPHRMAQSLGLRVKELKALLSDVNPATLPNQQEAKELQKIRLAEIEKNRIMRRGSGMYDHGGMVSQQMDALHHIKDKEKAAAREKEKEAQQKESQTARTVDPPSAPAREPEKRQPDHGGMASQQMDALRHTEDKEKAAAREKQKEAQQKESQTARTVEPPSIPTKGLEKRQPERSPVSRPLTIREQQEAAMRELSERGRGQTREQQRQQGREPQRSGAIGKEKTQAEATREHNKGKTEQTAEQIKQQQKEAMRELFERNFGRGHSSTTLEKWGRDRER